MANKIVRGVLIDINTNTVKTVELEDKLETYYKVLNCDLIEVVVRDFGKYSLDIICDEEALLKSPQPAPSVATYHKDELVELIVGNAFICASNDEGEFVSLTDDQIQAVLGCVAQYRKNDESFKILTARI